MSMLQPSSCTGYQLKLPQIPQSAEYALLDQYTRKKLSLEHRTGAAVELSRANLFVHGGLTVPLNIENITILQLQKELIIYFSKNSKNKINFENLNQWISSEIFFLDLVSRTWHHIETTIDDTPENPNLEIQTDLLCKDSQLSPLESPMKGRLFHSICYFGSTVYVFGGLVVSPHTGYELIATNELWKLDLKNRKWSLVSNDPRINRRYSHSMHVKNENVDTRDTKLIIVGGTNNISEPVTKIDIYNLTRNCWQHDIIPKESSNFVVNIDSKPLPLSIENNFSILVENNEAKVPALVIYNPNNQFDKDGIQENCDKNDEMEEEYISKRTNSNKMVSPMTTLPLIPDSNGMRLAYNNLQTPDILRESFNLQFPSGQYFGFNIIIGGYYPNCNPSNYCCFVYDIPSGRWTRVSIRSPNSEIVHSRYWKLFVWKSHHQTLLLGTTTNDNNLPSVQKFDHILVFGLPLINAFNKIITPPYLNEMKLGSLSLSPFQTALDDTIQQQLVFSTDDQPTIRTPSYVSGVTSQFENYIKYIAPSFELSTIKSTFPPFAVVLGKDSLEIYGDSLSDFEFITSEGDTVKVPIYLLRKRWGRYFDFLLSQGYSKICLENELSVKRSMLVKYTPISSRITSRASSRHDSVDYFRDSARSSLSRPSNRESPRSSNALERTASGPRKSLSQLFVNDIDDPTKYSRMKQPFRPNFSEKVTIEAPIPLIPPNDEELDINDPVSPPPDEHLLSLENSSDKDNYLSDNQIRRTGTTSTTSSTTGMVFRVPFQENKSPSSILESPFHKVTDRRRRSSLMDTHLSVNDELQTSRRNSAFKRRSSHPINSVKFEDTVVLPPQKLNRKLFAKFPSSTRSSFSYGGSTYDRKRNSLPSLEQKSSTPEAPLDVMTVDLPPTTESPDEPLPEVPTMKLGNNRRPSASIYDFTMSNKGSPFSSRRASFVSANSNPDWKGIAPLMNNLTLDEKLLQKNEELNRAQHNENNNRQSISQLRSRMFSKGSNSRENSLSNIPSLSDRTRPSIASFSESNDSILSTAPYDMEPLLIPRSLYLPWPTSSIKALSEFFYTGQTNGKWLLAPVALDLLVMAKLYEIPLLYTLIAEMLYSILGRKEEGLFVSCTTLKNGLIKQIKKLYRDDETRVENYLENSKAYKELLRLNKALVEIDNGFLNSSLLRKSSFNRSEGTHDSSEGDDLDKQFHRASSTGSFANYRQSIISYGSKDSRGSLGAAGFPPSLNFQEQKNSIGGVSPRIKKKSSLSKEIDPHSYFQDNILDVDKIKNKFRKDQSQGDIHNVEDGSNDYDFGNFDLGFELSTSSSDETSDDFASEVRSTNSTDIDTGLDRSKSNPELESLSTIVDARTNRNGEQGDENWDETMKRSSVSTSRGKAVKTLLNSYVDSGLGMSSLSRLKKKMKKAEEYADDSVDPLFKISSTLQSPGRPQVGPSRPSNLGSVYSGGKPGLKSPNMNILDEDYSVLRLECIVAANALPPVDHIIKYIFKTAVLVNDVKMTIRCADCLEISKDLKTVKKELAKEITNIKDQMKSSQTLKEDKLSPLHDSSI
ncbi:similar to Saccharomyces cerevisiae YGL197W MDS3 Putative component of the TOR regulatory pathway [Maudiozyma saulgeensis]|uniref:Similar to Saccharomyces cerevisiae YGL197W MDS3 Putative component of the TOR regulatory pathway n=1 Tax=Maudiozyma saulgeensis TaxID=1789683 RepID=A0A1X7QYM2_9SACH|nr:similar to Saccharomyces cerevisiae YGL197W MDS3 Putative component of the TOR regulatory pathway [Kazachstania saulgeensis]